MNREELKSLWGFLAIYISSALILMIIIAILYHSNETNKIHEKTLNGNKNCHHELRKRAHASRNG
ncbi:MAG: hypothetical protein LRY68_10595 [Sulfurospirillum sp.]|nr:hypothetical protein [Sulfurospirillum sp.]